MAIKNYLIAVFMLVMFSFCVTGLQDSDDDYKYYSIKGDVNVIEECRQINNDFCDNSTECNITVYDPDYEVIIENKVMQRNPTYYNYTF